MPNVTLLGGDEIKVELPDGAPLTELDSLLVFGCRMAACGACAIEVISGETNLSSMQANEKRFLEDIGLADGPYRLACQCKLLGDVILKQC